MNRNIVFGLAGFGAILIGIVVAALVCLLLAWPFMLLWNYAVVAALTIVKPINYWTAFWLMLFLSFFIVGYNSYKTNRK